MRPVNPLELALDINALSQEQRAIFYREAIRRAHAARSDAIRELFRTTATYFAHQSLLTRALVDSAAVLAVVIALGATLFEPASAGVASGSIGHVVSGLPLLW
jgi:hypothetical protein